MAIQDPVAIQHAIYPVFADRIGQLAETGDWGLLAISLPMGVVCGAMHGPYAPVTAR